jgi:cell wall-associated NlpC family hydrolase
MPARPLALVRRTAAIALPVVVLAAGLVAAAPAEAAPAVPTSTSLHAVPVTPIRTASPAPVLTAAQLRAAHLALVRQIERARVLRLAAALRGRPYQYGASGPGAFDCSGYTRYVFWHATRHLLPHSAAGQERISHRIARSAIRPGDLVFFVSGGYAYHVGIYAGHGLIWHAPHTGDHVRLSRIYTSSWVAGRVL